MTLWPLALEKLAKRPKVLLPSCIMSLFEIYEFQNGRSPDSQGCASKSTFKREFSLWKKFLIFHRAPDHARCTTCGRYAELRAKATSEEQKANICANHAQRIVDIFADRDTEAFFDRLGIESARPRYTQECCPSRSLCSNHSTEVSRQCLSEGLKAGAIQNLAGRSFGQFQSFNWGI